MISQALGPGDQWLAKRELEFSGAYKCALMMKELPKDFTA